MEINYEEQTLKQEKEQSENLKNFFQAIKESYKDNFQSLKQLISESKNQEDAEQLLDTLQNLQQKLNEVQIEQYMIWCKLRKQTIEQIRNEAEEIDKVNKKCLKSQKMGNKASIIGGSLSVVGGLMCLTGIGAIVGGPMLASGMATGIGGGATNAGAAVCDTVLQNKCQKRVEQIIQQDQEYSKFLRDKIEEIAILVDQIAKILDKMSLDSKGFALCTINSGSVIYNMLKGFQLVQNLSASSNILMATSTIALQSTVFLGIIFIGWNLKVQRDLEKQGLELCELYKRLNQIADQLEQEMEKYDIFFKQ